MNNERLFAYMLASVEHKLITAIEVLGFESYAAARGYVQPRTTAGAKVWDILDAKYSNGIIPHHATQGE